MTKEDFIEASKVLVNRGFYKDLFISKEALEDIHRWVYSNKRLILSKKVIL